MKKLYFGGDIVTMENENDLVEAVLIENGLIKEVYNTTEFQMFMNDSTVEKINLDGKTLMPGFIDPHGHIAMMGAFSEMADLTKCESFDDIVATLKQHIITKGLDKDDKVVGFGYEKDFMREERHPTKEILDKVSTENPIFAFHAGAHTGCTNDEGLRLFGIDENTPDQDGGFIGRVEGTNEPNGYLEEGNWLPQAFQLLFNFSSDKQLELGKIGQEVYVKNGITTAQEGKTSSEDFKLLKMLGDSGDLKIDVVAYPSVIDNPEDMWSDSKYIKKYHNRLKIGGYKFFLDGSPQARTAWMTEPYEGEESYRAYPWYEEEQVKECILKAVNDNVQLLTHSNGDAAADQLIRNYEAALGASDNPNKHNLRPVMIHCQTVRNDQLDKMVELSMIPSIFVAHTYYWGDTHLKNFGNKRGRRISPAKSAFDRGLMVNFHQDAPVILPDMLETIWCAVNRITRKGINIGPEESVSVYDALKAVTINGAYSYFEEEQKGSIKEGKLADLVILDGNPLKVNKMNIKDIQVVETIKEGETIYKRDSVLTQ